MRAMKAGLRLKSAVCSAEIMVLRTSVMQADVRCGGVAMLALGEAPPPNARLDPTQAQGTLIGKRYVDAQDRVEILCTQGGEGSLMFDGVAMTVKQAKALPSSD
jgi:hypothetical protein